MPYGYDNGWGSGGFGYSGLFDDTTNQYDDASVTGFLGRLWNNLSGRTASNQFNAHEAQLAREYSSAEAQKDRNFQTYMSNTALQRGVADAKAAGINPAALGGDVAASSQFGTQAHSAPAAQASTATGSGFFTGILRTVLGAALFKKFGNTASAAAKSGGSTSKIIDSVGRQYASALRAWREMNEYMVRNVKHDVW